MDYFQKYFEEGDGSGVGQKKTSNNCSDQSCDFLKSEQFGKYFMLSKEINNIHKPISGSNTSLTIYCDKTNYFILPLIGLWYVK